MSSTSPLRILIQAGNVAALAQAMTIPHLFHTFDGRDEEQIRSRLPQTDVLVSGRFQGSWIGGPTPLRLVHCFGAGTELVEREGLPPGCILCNVYGHGSAIAEHVFMIMLALNRHLLAQDAALRRGDWGDRAMLRELRGRTLLILGMGHIGCELARWGLFMGMRVTGLTRRPSPQRAASLGLSALGSLADIERLLKEADFVAVALPQTPETTGLIGRRQLEQMKSSAFLINVARGPIVEEQALFQALQQGTIAGAGIDVWYQSPRPGEPVFPSRYPFQELSNVIMTPSLSGYTHETMRHRWAVIADNLRRLVAGEPLQHVVWTAPGRPPDREIPNPAVSSGETQ